MYYSITYLWWSYFACCWQWNSRITLCITALEAWFCISYSAERQSLFQMPHHGTQGHQEKTLSFLWEVGRFRDRCEGTPQPQMQCCQGELWLYRMKACFYSGVTTGWSKLFSRNYSSTTATSHGSGFTCYKESARCNLSNTSLWYSHRDIQ